MRTKIQRIRNLVIEQLALLTAEFIIIIILSFVTAWLFYKMAEWLLLNQLEAFDFFATQWVRFFASPGMDAFMRSVTFLSNREFVYIPALLVFVYFLFIKPHRWFSIKIPVVAIGSVTGNILLKEMYQRTRPLLPDLVEVSGLSFPSGHAMFSIAFYGLLVYIVWERLHRPLLRYSLTFLLAIIIFLIGVSRVYLGVHYPSDVVAGFAAGFLWLTVSILAIRYIERIIKRRSQAMAMAN